MNKLRTLKVDYKTLKCDLCEIGRVYDTDKSAWRDNRTLFRHSHPYTLFYNALFKNNRFDKLKIVELGILKGASLLMWNLYFQNSIIYGLENNIEYIKEFLYLNESERIKLGYIDIKNKENIIETFNIINEKFELIIDDTTHNVDDQLQIIETMYKYLKPGGMLIIEDIMKNTDENIYIKTIETLKDEYQDYYFVELDHFNKWSPDYNNDKLLILIKSGGEKIFKNNNKITLITPSYRVNNLKIIEESIDFNYIDEWIIVYDGNRIENPGKQFTNDKITEYYYENKEHGIFGNTLRNYALDNVKNKDTFIYYLDDDNTINSNLYRLLDIVEKNRIYTFDQDNNVNGDNNNILKGDKIEFQKIDSGMVLMDYNICKNVKWNPEIYAADFQHIKECYDNNKYKHIYVNNILSNYNRLAC